MPLIETLDIRQLGPYDCGRACAAMVLGFYRVPAADAASMIGRLRVCKHDGVDPGELAGWFRSEGWLVAEGWHDVDTVRHHGYEGRPVILLATLHDGGHWVVSRGVIRKTIYLQDPYSGRDKYPVEDFIGVWHDRDRYGTRFVQWAVVACPKTDQR